MLGYRKFSITLLCIALLTTLLLTGYVGGVSYAKALSGIVIAFVSANVGEHILNLGKDYINKSNKEK